MTIRETLTDLVAAAWGDGYTAEVLTANGLSVESIIRSQLIPNPTEILALSYTGFTRQPSTREDGGYSDDEPIYQHDWTLSIRCRGVGIADDDDLFTLVVGVAEYFRQRNRITGPDGRKYRIDIADGRAVSSDDLSYQAFEIPITLL